MSLLDISMAVFIAAVFIVGMVLVIKVAIIDEKKTRK